MSLEISMDALTSYVTWSKVFLLNPATGWLFLAYLGLPGRHGNMFLYNGGYATLISYGVNSKQSSLDEITSEISSDHIDFLKNLRMYFVMGRFICVHAGINPSKPLA